MENVGVVKIKSPGRNDDCQLLLLLHLATLKKPYGYRSKVLVIETNQSGLSKVLL